MHIDTLLAQLDHLIDPATAGLAPSIHPATTFARGPDNQPLVPGHVYGRDQNPGYRQVESILAKLEGGEAAMLLPSGQAAGMLFFHALKPGDHVILGQHMYWALRQEILRFCNTWGIGQSVLDLRDIGAVRAAIQPSTRLILAEAPSNPMLHMPDIPLLAESCHGRGVALVVDATAATPILLQPLALGADFVFHATTKALNGHSDALGGVVIARHTQHELWQAMVPLRASLGSVSSAFDAWLLLRGLRTAALRVRQASANALALAQAVRGHAAVLELLYPDSDLIAQRDMHDGFGCLLSLRLMGGPTAALRVLEKLQLFLRATSLGGTESLVEYRSAIEGPTSPVPDDLLRFSIGIEHIDDLKADLLQALDHD